MTSIDSYRNGRASATDDDKQKSIWLQKKWLEWATKYLKDNQEALERNGIYNVTDLFWRLVELGKPELEKLISLMNRPLPRFEQINSDANGVKILDRELRNVVEVYFKPTGVRCSYDNSNQCSHITFAFSIPAVVEIIRKRRTEGWKLPEV